MTPTLWQSGNLLQVSEVDVKDDSWAVMWVSMKGVRSERCLVGPKAGSMVERLAAPWVSSRALLWVDLWVDQKDSLAGRSAG